MLRLVEDKADDDDMVQFYRQHASVILSYIYQQVPHWQEAEDLTVEVFMAALQEKSLLRFSDGHQLAWLRRVARNKIVDRYRRQPHLMHSLQDVAEQPDAALTPEQYVLQQEKYAYLQALLEDLSPLQQQVLSLRYGKSLRFAAIAATLKHSEAGVRKLLSRTLRQLRTVYHQKEM